MRIDGLSQVVTIERGQEVECDLAKVTERAVLVRCDGVWTELRPEEADRELKIAIERLELERGDILVVKSEAVRDQRTPVDLSYFLPAGVRVMFITPDVDLSVLKRADIEARAN